MLNKRMSSRYYLFSLSNLIAAFGGGAILGKGVGVIDLPLLHGDSILAFFIGTLLGLVFLQGIPEKFSKPIAKFFSINCGLTSLILFYIYQIHSSESKLEGKAAIIFFILLCIRFAFWFYSRVMRASEASGHQQSIAWVELGYYLGMGLGLILWKLIGINVGLGAALLIDACLQFFAGILDYRSNVFPKPIIQKQKQSTPINPPTTHNTLWCWKLASAVIFFTIGIQIVIFNSSHYVLETLSANMIGIFYFGVATAAFICNHYKIYIAWDAHNKFAYIHLKNSNIRFSLTWFSLISALAVIATAYYATLNDDSVLNDLFVYFFVFTAAFFYEVISLVILDRLGYEEKMIHSSGMIMRTYGLMGLASAVSLWILGFLDYYFIGSTLTVVLCVAFSLLFISRRDETTLTHLTLQNEP